MKILFSFALLASVIVACGDNTPAKDPSTTAASGARPSCDAIDSACDPYENQPGLGKECHDLGESKSSTEVQCAAKKDACLAACPKK